MTIPFRQYAFLSLATLATVGCSKDKEPVTPAPSLVGQWDAKSVQLVSFNAAGDTVHQVKDSSTDAYLIFASDQTYSSYYKNVVSWSGTYSWQDLSLSTKNPVQGTQSFTITTLSPTSLVLLNDRRTGKEGSITISKYTRH